MDSSVDIRKDTISSWVYSFSDDLYAWALYKTSNKEQAEDLVQETFISALNALPKFEHRSNPKTWLFKILNNKIIDYYRKNINHSHYSIEDEIEKGIHNIDSLFDSNGNWSNYGLGHHWEEESNLLDNKKFNIVFKNCIENLPSVWKTAVRAKYLLDKNSSEICQDLEISLSNYWQIIHRAKLHLKKCLESGWFKKIV